MPLEFQCNIRTSCASYPSCVHDDSIFSRSSHGGSNYDEVRSDLLVWSPALVFLQTRQSTVAKAPKAAVQDS